MRTSLTGFLPPPLPGPLFSSSRAHQSFAQVTRTQRELAFPVRSHVRRCLSRHGPVRPPLATTATKHRKCGQGGCGPGFYILFSSKLKFQKESRVKYFSISAQLCFGRTSFYFVQTCLPAEWAGSIQRAVDLRDRGRGKVRVPSVSLVLLY